jgi:secondary thiamine-phosphate synthase enzyme
MKIIKIHTKERVEVIDITSEVRRAVEESGTKDGICTVFTLHTTTALILNEREERLINDLKNFLEKFVPSKGNYKHNEIDSNADSHLRAILLSPSISIPVADGDLFLGTWQSILFVELDGPRSRNLIVKVVGK